MSSNQFLAVWAIVMAAMAFGYWQGKSNATEAHERIVKYMTPECRAAMKTAIETMNWVDEERSGRD